MRQAITISQLVVVLIMVWTGSLYYAQDYGYQRGKESREVLLCQDALQRRIETERAVTQTFISHDAVGNPVVVSAIDN